MSINQHILIYLDVKQLNKDTSTEIYSALSNYSCSTLVIDNCEDKDDDCFKQNKNIKIVNVKDFVTPGLLDNIENSSISLSKVLSRLEKNYLNYKNISLGDVIDHELYSRYFDVLENILIVDKIIYVEKPDIFLKYTDHDIFSKELKAIIEQKHSIVMNVINLDTRNIIRTRFREILVFTINIFSTIINIYAAKNIIKYYVDKIKPKGYGQRKEREPFVSQMQCRNVDDSAKPYFAIDNSNASCIDTVLPLFCSFNTKSIITDNLDVVKIFSKFNDCKIIYVTLFRPLWSFRFILYFFHFLDIRQELKKNECLINGFNLSPLLLKDLQNIVIRTFPAIISSIIAMEKIFKKEPYNVVVLPTQCTQFDEALIKVADNFNVPSLVVQHGICGRAYGFSPIIATQMAVWGDRDKSFLENNKADLNKLKVVGCPRFDSLINNSFSHNEILKKYNLPSKNIILFATTQMMAEFYKNNDLLSEVIKVLGSLENSIFIIKPHPSENIIKYEQLFVDLNITNGIIIRNADLNELIVISNLVITFPSTGPLHSMLLRKRTVLFGFDNIYSKYPELTNIADVSAVNTGLKPLLCNCDSEEVNYDNVLNDFFYKTDGNSTGRVVELINQLHSSNMHKKSKRCL